MLKMILTPYEGKIIKHTPETESAVVFFPNREALEALKDIPSYKTVEIPRPQDETPQSPAPEPAEEEKIPEGEEAQKDPAAAAGEAGGEHGEEEATPVEDEVDQTVAQNVVPEATAHAAEQTPRPQTAVETPAVEGVKRKPLPANDVFYLFGDENIVVPTWCIFLLAYSVLAVFGVC